MFYVTKEIKKKELREILKENTSFKEFKIDNKDRYYKEESANPLILGNAYELVLQLYKYKKEHNLSELRNMKFFRGFNNLISFDSIKGKKYIKKQKKLVQIFKEELEILIKYIKGEKVKRNRLAHAILYMVFIENFREQKNIYYLEPIYTKGDIKEVKRFLKNMKKGILKEALKDKELGFNILISDGYLAGEIDILQKDKIIDIKTTGNPIFTKDMFYQLLIYYFILKRKGVKIKKGAIFFSKYNKLVNISFKKYIKNEEEIEKYIGERYT